MVPKCLTFFARLPMSRLALAGAPFSLMSFRFPNLGPLHERNFRLYFFGRTVSLFGSAFAPVAIAFAVLELGGSPAALSLILATFIVPQIVFMLAGGVWADRLPRHLVVIFSDGVSGAAQLVAAILFITGRIEIWELVVIAGVRGAASALFMPAASGIIPQVVSEAHLQQANALLQLGSNIARVSGTASAGVVVAATNPGWALLVDALTYFAGMAFLAALSLPNLTGLRKPNFGAELKEGWDEFRARRWLWVMVVQFAFVNAIGMGAFFVLGPFVAEQSLGGAAAWGFVLTAQTLGAIIGGVVGLRLRPRRPLLVACALALTTIAPLVLLAIPAAIAIVAMGAFVFGLGLQLYAIYWSTTLQRQIPGDKLSRVSSYDVVGSFALIPVGMLVIGPIANAVGYATTLVSAAIVVAAATGGALFVTDIWRMRDAPVDRAANESAASANA